MKKITLATVKSFIKKNKDRLYIQNIKDFDGMIDGCRKCDDQTFKIAKFGDDRAINTLDIFGAWFVGQSSDRFSPYEDENFLGISVYNCCGSFVLATQK